jgi:hypothetical protein
MYPRDSNRDFPAEAALIVTQESISENRFRGQQMIKRRTEITIDIDRVMIVSQSKNHKSWCEICGTHVSMATARQAAEMLQTSEAVIYRLAENGKLHFSTTTEGMLLICYDSLIALLKTEVARRQAGFSSANPNAPAD